MMTTANINILQSLHRNTDIRQRACLTPILGFNLKVRFEVRSYLIHTDLLGTVMQRTPSPSTSQLMSQYLT
jgi:hypothetical protein